ncbi:TrmH family RNA methyltransferase [Yimella sp. cx-51]|uniref:TrmH family RNA methyltransferase n=1 Tax=Yimella sp. cx-51 TaxID=2770551 RepID=UPI00351C7777
MAVITIDDPRDDRVRDYFGLTDVALRRVLEPQEGLYLAESEKVIRRALGAGHRPRSFLMARRWLDDLADVVGDAERDDIPVFVAEAGVIEAMTGFHLHRGALASMHRPLMPAWQVVVRDAQRVLVIEDVVDHTNVGAIFRSAAAMGADAVLVTPRCADPLYRRAVRVSMGTVFQVPWTRVEPWPHAISELRESGWHVAALALDDDAVSLDELAAAEHDRLCLVVGTEGGGLSRSTIAGSSQTVSIPMAGGVDSLNVAAASAVALWATKRRGQRS